MAFDGNNRTGRRAGSNSNGSRRDRRRSSSRSPRERPTGSRGRSGSPAPRPPKFKGAPKARKDFLGRRRRVSDRPAPTRSPMGRPGQSQAPSNVRPRPVSSHVVTGLGSRGTVVQGQSRRSPVNRDQQRRLQVVAPPAAQQRGSRRRGRRSSTGSTPRSGRGPARNLNASRNPAGYQPNRRFPQRPPRKPRPMVSTLRYALRLLIVGVGLGVLAGTVLSSIDPSLRYSTEATSSETAANSAEAPKPKPKGIRLGQEMSGLKTQIESLIAANEGLTAGVFVVDIDTGSYLDINSRRRFASASTIKLPILVALFEEIDAGNISLNEQLTMTPELIATEAGEMQFLPPGTQFSVLDTATEMIRISDNTATNLLIDRLGGPARLNQRFQSWGLQQTQVSNLLPDLEGTNTISPNDLVTLMGRINQGEVVSLRSRDRLLGILRLTQTNDLLPQGIGPGASIAHKTGNIGKVIGDVGLVDMPSGKRYIIMAMVERPHGDWSAEELIRNISAETYQFLEATGSTSEQMQPTMPHSNIADQEPKRAPSIMTTDP